MNYSKLALGTIMVTAFSVSAALAEPMSDTSNSNGNSVPVLSGGIADSGMDAIKQEQNNYNLKLVFAEKDGAYLADVGVQVKDRAGNIVADTTSPGPVLLMKLPAGSYTVSSTQSGQTETQHVSVHGERGLKTYIVHFASNDDNTSTANMQ